MKPARTAEIWPTAAAKLRFVDVQNWIVGSFVKLSENISKRRHNMSDFTLSGVINKVIDKAQYLHSLP